MTWCELHAPNSDLVFLPNFRPAVCSPKRAVLIRDFFRPLDTVPNLYLNHLDCISSRTYGSPQYSQWSCKLSTDHRRLHRDSFARL